MKKRIVFCFLVAVAASALAQSPSEASRKYHEYRQTTTTPSYGIAKVKKLIGRIKEDSDMNRRISTKAFNRLTVEEKFTYTMIHGEDFSQNCEAMPPIEDENKKIFSHTLDAFRDEAAWSDRQRAFLTNNRMKVIALVRTSMRTHKPVGANLKQTIWQINAYELIPDLIAAFARDKHDLDLYTVMMLLMKEGKYQPFLASASYKKLYGDDNGWQAYLDANAENRKLIADRALAYYKSKKK